MTVVVEDRSAFTLSTYRRVSVDGEDVEIGPRARQAMTAARASFEALLDSDRSAFIYGTTTRAGEGARTPLTAEQQRAFANEMGSRRRGGWGFGDRHLDPRVVRGIIFARLSNYVEGHAKSRPVVAERIAAMLSRPMPVVPLDGQIGAGEVLPLAHVMGDAQLGELREGEPMAVINGSPCAAALSADAALHARHRLTLATGVMALSIEAFGAPLDAYDEDLDALYGDPHEAAALVAMRGWLRGAESNGRRSYQAPVSYRIIPRVLAAADRAVAAIEETAAISLRSITDNPVYLLPSEDHPLGAAISTGGYHNAMASPALDALSAAWADLCVLADRHVTKLFDQLAASPTEEGHARRRVSPGAAGLGFLAASFNEQARDAARRTLLPVSEGGGYLGQNDVAVPTFLAYQRERRAAECLDGSLAILAVSCSEILHLLQRPPAVGLQRFLGGVRGLCPPGDTDGDALQALARRIETCSLTGEELAL
jgi:histidine ammonia-lyase